jgi:hypothetical protein
MPDDTTASWPPRYTLNQERILKLLTGDRFYSDASAALREAILNALDAVYRINQLDPDIVPAISVTFDRDSNTLSVEDNGDGMGRDAISTLFTKVGSSAADLEANQGAVGEFGIGSISYFMAADSFSIQTFDGFTAPLGLNFSKEMLAGDPAALLPSMRTARGTTLQLNLRNVETFDLLLKAFPHWCRDVEGLTAKILPDDQPVLQGGIVYPNSIVALPIPDWVERTHLAPVVGLGGWDVMSGSSKISVLYRGVFVQEFVAAGLWGITGSIDVNPKRFKPRLNRESFVETEFKTEMAAFLKRSHPAILTAMASSLASAIEKGELSKWTEHRWATLWLSIPRTPEYATVSHRWDAIFRSVPAFELAERNTWKPISLNQLSTLSGLIYLAPPREKKNQNNDLINAAVRLLRHSPEARVFRGIQPDRNWLQDVSHTFRTTADLILQVFSRELPKITNISQEANSILESIKPVAILFGGTHQVALVRLGSEGPPILRLSARLIVNLDHPLGRAITDDVLAENRGRGSLIEITARHSYEHLGQVAAAVKQSPQEAETLGLVKRRFIKGLLT